MKKLFAMILALALILTLAACGNDTPAESTPTTSAPTKTETKWLVETETYVYEDPSLGTISSTYTYDAKGNPLTVVQKTSSGNLNVEYTYNDAGQCTGMNVSQAGTTMRYVFTLDANGNRAKAEIYNDDKLFQTTNASFDENGNMTLQETKSDNFSTKNVYTYDAAGNMISAVSSINGELNTTTELKYDDQGRQLAATTVDADGNIVTTIDVTYEADTVTQVTKDDAGNVVTTLVKKLDEHGNTIEMTNSGTGTSPYTYTATYISKEVPVSE